MALEQGTHLAETFERSLDEGEYRLERTWRGVMATGAVGGIDIGIGVLALLVVHHLTGSDLLAALAFTVGFIALVLGNSELFTENFLVPITAVVAGRSTPWKLGRLWIGTLTMNLLGGWAVMWIVISGAPFLERAAIEAGTLLPTIGITWRAFALAMLGGLTITLMTWMERGTTSVMATLVAAIASGFLLAIVPLSHSVVSSLKMFGALHAGAPFGYADFVGALGWSVAGNVVGGVGLVTVLRLIQVGAGKVKQERRD